MNSIRNPLPPTEHGVEYRAMRASDLDPAWSLSLDQHWPHRPRDWSTAFSLGEGVVATVDGQLVGTAMRWLWGETHATIGLVIVSELMRGRRIGSALMNRILEGLEDRIVSLHATEEGRGMYERLGFVRTGEIRQHQGIASNAPLIALDEGWRLRPMDNSDEPALFEFDKQARGWERPQLLRTWLDTSERVMVLDHAGTLDGFAFLRRFGRGVVVGPVVASDDIGARALIGHLIGTAAGRFVRIDLDYDSGLTTWMEELQLQRAGTVTAMTRGPLPHGAGGARLFALASQALG
jgi:ribosomal protein S18 acetylase RimI-like enzyme